MPHLEQIRFESGDDVINDYCHFVERFKNGLATDNLRLSERYVGFELEIVVRFSVVGAGGNVHNFVSHLKRHRGGLGKAWALPVSSINSPFVESSDGGYQEAVFVNAVELVDMPECFIPTYIRLYGEEEFFRTKRNTLYFSFTDRRCKFLLPLGIRTDREVGVPVGSATTSVHELPSKMVKGTPQVVYGVSNDERDGVRNRIDTCDVQRRMVNFRYTVRLGPDFIRMVVAEGSDPGIQVTDVLLGPVGLPSDAIKSVTHIDSAAGYDWRMKSNAKPIGGDAFNAALGQVLQVSKAELQRREEEWKREHAGKPKRGPKPKTSASGHACRDTG